MKQGKKVNAPFANTNVENTAPAKKPNVLEQVIFLTTENDLINVFFSSTSKMKLISKKHRTLLKKKIRIAEQRPS